MTTVVVAGAGLAGLRTIEGLRARGFAGRLVLVGAEPQPPYDRPPLSKEVLRGQRDEPWLRASEDYDALDVELRCGQRVSRLDIVNRALSIDDESVEFDILVVATGARPRRVLGLDGYVLRTWQDALTLRGRLLPGTSLVTVGAGLIGCEVAASARSLGVDVTLVDVENGPLVRVLGPTVAPILAAHHHQNGVRLCFNESATRMPEGQVLLSGGTTIQADHVLEAVGVVPETEWLTDSGLALSNGVDCDEVGRTSVDGVFAVGDVANWAGIRAEHWSSAVEQANRVAAAIVGQPVPPPDVPYWWSDQYDLKIQGLGSPQPTDDVALLKWGPKHRTVAVYSNNGLITGIVGFSAARAVMTTRADIAARTDVQQVIDRLADGWQ